MANLSTQRWTTEVYEPLKTREGRLLITAVADDPEAFGISPEHKNFLKEAVLTPAILSPEWVDGLHALRTTHADLLERRMLAIDSTVRLLGGHIELTTKPSYYYVLMTKEQRQEAAVSSSQDL